MGKKKAEDFINTAFDNIIRDREKLEDLYDNINKLAKDSNDILGLAAVGENLVKIADSLTKQTGQIVELAKLKSKNEVPQKKDEDGFSESEIYSAIEKERSN